jgi:hypothetical protein
VDHGGRYYHQEETSNIMCRTIRQDKEGTVVMVNHETRGCTTGYVCTALTMRASTVVEVRMGAMAMTQDYACDKEYFNSSLPAMTIVGNIMARLSGARGHSCPFHGSFSVSIRHSDFSLAVKPDTLSSSGSSTSSCLVPYSLHMGCTHPSKQEMVFTACQGSLQESSVHSCITQWQQGEEQFFISRTASRTRFVCYSFKKVGDMIMVVMMGQQCTAGEVGSFPFNISRVSDCSDINTSDRTCLGYGSVLVLLCLYLCDR